MADLKSSKFTVSPPGLGWDCHRTWESVLFGSIPIVLSSATYCDLYRDSPVMVVDGWGQVTRDSLERYEVSSTNRDVIFVDYWLDRIREVVDGWRRGRTTEKTLG